MSIPQNDCKRLLGQIEMAEQYQKTMHAGHGFENTNCITHCTTFGLSDGKCSEHHFNCTEPHTFECLDCINVIRTLDKIGERISKMSLGEIKIEA